MHRTLFFCGLDGFESVLEPNSRRVNEACEKITSYWKLPLWIVQKQEQGSYLPREHIWRVTSYKQVTLLYKRETYLPCCPLAPMIPEAESSEKLPIPIRIKGYILLQYKAMLNVMEMWILPDIFQQAKTSSKLSLVFIVKTYFWIVFPKT